MLPTVLLLVAALAIAPGVLISRQPELCRVTRSIAIDAPPAAVFAQANDFHRWPSWSPYEQLDPAAERTYEGPPAGSGAAYAWSGNRRVGDGRMSIHGSRPSERIDLRFEIFRPFACDNAVEFTFRREGAHTIATWSMAGRANFVAKAIHLVTCFDKIVGGQFEQGLARLKQVSEAVGAA